MIDSRRLLDTFLTILRIDSYHPNEDPVIDALRPKLEGAGVRLSVDAHRNVLGFWPGTGPRAGEEPILLCAHTDTVRPTPGMEPVIRDGAVHTDGSSVLGADDKAAVAAIVEAVQAIADEGAPHPPVEVLFTVGEDVGHIGSKAFDVAGVRSRMAFVPDVDGPCSGRHHHGRSDRGELPRHLPRPRRARRYGAGGRGPERGADGRARDRPHAARQAVSTTRRPPTPGC